MYLYLLVIKQAIHGMNEIYPGDFVTNMKQINGQSYLISMSSFAGPSYLSIRSSVCMIWIWDPCIFNFYNLCHTLDQLHTSETSPVCTSCQRKNNKSTIPSVTVFCQESSSSSYFAVERAAEPLHRMSPCTPVSVPAKITWIAILWTANAPDILSKIWMLWSSYCFINSYQTER